MTRRSRLLRNFVVPVLTIGTFLLGGSLTTVSGATAAPNPLGDRTSQIVSGGGHRTNEAFTLGLDPDGHLWAWGDNASGQLGDGSTTRRLTPTAVTPDRVYSDVAAGSRHAVALDSGGRLYAWGNGDNGQTTYASSTVPKLIGPADRRYVAVDAGIDVSYAIDTNGQLWSWGTGSLGRGSGWLTKSPMAQAAPTERFKQVSIGVNHTLALATDGSVWAWGDNSQGKLGRGTISVSESAPAKVNASTKFSQVSAGSGHSAALDEAGSLWTWGANFDSFFGNDVALSAEASILSPTKVDSPRPYVSLATGVDRTLVVDIGGTLWMSERHAAGVTSPGYAKVLPAVSFKSVEAHDDNMVAVSDTNGFWVWGDNATGQNGTGAIGGAAAEPLLTQVRRYAVNLLTNPSLLTAGTTATVRENLVLDPQMVTMTNTSAYYNMPLSIAKGTPNAIGGVTDSDTLPQGLIYLRDGLGPGTYTASAYVRGTAGERVVFSGRTITPSSEGYGATSVTLNGQWQRMSATFTLTGASYEKIGFQVRTDARKKGVSLQWSKTLLEKSPTLGPWFTGAGADSGDSKLWYAWTGPVNNSVSREYGARPEGYTPSTVIPVITSEWASTGPTSVRLIPDSATPDSFMYLPVDLTYMRGKTFTISGKLRMTGPQTGPENWAMRQIAVVAYSETSPVSARSAVAPNAAGVTDHRVVATIPLDATYVTFRWYNGAAIGGGDVWWDDLMFVEGDYDGPYIDGTIPGANWLGAADASASKAPLPDHPSISLTKTSNGLVSLTQKDAPTFVAGSTVDWGFNVKNTGDEVLTNVAPVDSAGVPVTCSKSTVRPSETLRCTGAGVVGAGSYGQ